MHLKTISVSNGRNSKKTFAYAKGASNDEPTIFRYCFFIVRRVSLKFVIYYFFIARPTAQCSVCTASQPVVAESKTFNRINHDAQKCRIYGWRHYLRHCHAHCPSHHIRFHGNNTLTGDLQPTMASTLARNSQLYTKCRQNTMCDCDCDCLS